MTAKSVPPNTTASPGFAKPLISQEVAQSVRDQIITGRPSPNRTQAGRFTKGHTGNPGGRPRKNGPNSDLPFTTDIDTAVLKLANKKVQVREGGEIREITISEAVIQAEMKSAMAGSSHAQRNAIARIKEAKQQDALRIAEDNAIWSLYKEISTAELAEARQQGLAEPAVYPHPDDIIIEDGKPPRFLGPWNEAQAKEYEQLVRLRNVLLLQHEYESRCEDPSLEVMDRNCAFYLFLRLNIMLPPSLRLSDTDIRYRSWQNERIPMRVLLKKLRQDYRSLGLRYKRGYRFPSIRVARNKLNPQIAALTALLSGEIKTEGLSPTQLEDEITRWQSSRLR